jgi:hypothetical protein
MFSLVSLIRRSVDYSVHENWRFIVCAMNAMNKTPALFFPQSKKSAAHALFLTPTLKNWAKSLGVYLAL